MGLRSGWWVLAGVENEVGGWWWVLIGVEIGVGGWWVLWWWRWRFCGGFSAVVCGTSFGSAWGMGCGSPILGLYV